MDEHYYYWYYFPDPNLMMNSWSNNLHPSQSYYLWTDPCDLYMLQPQALDPQGDRRSQYNYGIDRRFFVYNPHSIPKSIVFQSQFSQSDSSGMHVNLECEGEVRKATRVPEQCRSISVLEDSVLVTNEKERISLPSDIVFQILERLPSRSVLRFRAVCKLWNSVSREHHFINRHLHIRSISSLDDLSMIAVSYTEKKLHTCYCTDKSYTFDMTSFFRDDVMHVYMSSPCDGMVCVYGKKTVCVVNPSINEVLVLPEVRHVTRYSTVALARTSSRGKYKVVRVFKHRDGSIGCEIFDLGNSQSWRIVRGAPSIHFYTFPVFANGAIYWMPKHYEKSDTIVSFDVDKEVFDMIRHPEDVFKVTAQWLTVLDGQLCLMATPTRSEDHTFGSRRKCKEPLHLWVLGDCKSLVWKYYRISLHQFGGDYKGAYSVKPLKITEDGKILCSGRNNSFHCYDLKSGTFTRSVIGLPNKDGYNNVYSYKESLVSPIALQEDKDATVAPSSRRWRRYQGAWGRCLCHI